MERRTENFELEISENYSIEVEAVESLDWEGLGDSCPECGGSEYHHISYSGGLYGHLDGVVVERTDYWFEKGGLYTECLECDEVLYKNPSYDVLQAYAEGEFDQVLD